MMEDKIITVKNTQGVADTQAKILYKSNLNYTPKFSIIIPVYNAEKYLHQCLNSLINQSLKEIEIICVDDGSTDSSLKILKEYAQKDNRFTILNQENLYAGVARNAGLTVAKGEYIHFFDADDFINQMDVYEIIYKKLKEINYPNVMRIISCKRIDAETNNTAYIGISEALLKNKNKILNTIEDYEIVRQINVVPWLGIIKKDYLLENNLKFINSICSNDYSFFIETLFSTKEIYLFDFDFVTHRINNSSSLIGIRKKHFSSIFTSVNRVRDFLNNNSSIPDDIKKRIMLSALNNLLCFYKRYENEKEFKEIHLQTIAFIKTFDIEKLKPEIENSINYNIIKSLKKKNLTIEHLIAPIKFNSSTYFKTEQEIIREKIKIWYRGQIGKNLNLNHPKTYNEKIQWLKLYDSTPIKTQLADKYLVRNWIKEKIGEKYLIPLLGVYDNFNEINFDELPHQFVIKCNHECGFNYIVKNKQDINLEDLKDTVRIWLNKNYAYAYSYELHYKNIQPKIIIEKYIENQASKDLYDYKFWCFNGKVEYIQFLSERNTNGLKMAFYDKNWNKQDFVYNYPLDKKNIEKPNNLNEMIELAEKLSKDFPHVRVDFYRLDDGQIYFGEMTFASCSGMCRWNKQKINKKLGKLIKLPKQAYNIDNNKYEKTPFYLFEEFENIFSIKDSLHKKYKFITILNINIKLNMQISFKTAWNKLILISNLKLKSI